MSRVAKLGFGVHAATRWTTDLLFPKRCAICGREGILLCADCAAALPRLSGPLCSRCGLTVKASEACSRCAAHPLPLDGLRSLYAMEGGARQLVHQLKYGGLRALAEPLGAELARLVRAWNPPVEMATPVPLHSQRLRERGFDQADLLARALSEAGGLALTAGLQRTRATPQQVRALSREERARNLADAFAWVEGVIEGRHILLVDDVATTGATLSAAAAALRAAGASGVWAVTLAREL